MGEIADDMINGACCSLCNVYMVRNVMPVDTQDDTWILRNESTS